MQEDQVCGRGVLGTKKGYMRAEWWEGGPKPYMRAAWWEGGPKPYMTT